MARTLKSARAPAAALLRPAALALAVFATFATASASERPNVIASQGGVARWAGLAAADCGFHGKRYPAVDAACYYPIDLRAKIGVHEIALYDQDGKQHLGSLTVEASVFPEVEITLPDERFVHPSATDLARHLGECKRVLVGPVRICISVCAGSAPA